MNEDITATLQLVYTCPAESSLAAQSDMIHDDVGRLLDADSDTGVALSAFTIQHVQSEAMTYGNTPPRAVGERESARITKLLGCGYRDAETIGEAMSIALCDMRHLADQQGLNFALWDKSGYRIYAAERHQARQAQGQGVAT